jgi:hypothetical protein
MCSLNKFSLTSLLSHVYSQQVFLDKFTFSCVLSTSFPWQVYLLVCTVNKFSLTSFQVLFARVHGMLLNIYLTSRPPFVCQNHRSISCRLVRFSLAYVHANKLSLSELKMACPAQAQLWRKALLHVHFSLYTPRTNKSCEGKPKPGSHIPAVCRQAIVVSGSTK